MAPQKLCSHDATVIKRIRFSTNLIQMITARSSVILCNTFKTCVTALFVIDRYSRGMTYRQFSWKSLHTKMAAKHDDPIRQGLKPKGIWVHKEKYSCPDVAPLKPNIYYTRNQSVDLVFIQALGICISISQQRTADLQCGTSRIRY